MENFDMDADENGEQENDVIGTSIERKSHQPSGIELEALTGLLDSYSTNSRRSVVHSQLSSSPRPIAPNTPIRQVTNNLVNTPIQSKTPNLIAFNARSNQSEILIEHLGSKIASIDEETKKRMAQYRPTIQLKSKIQPYKFMYQTIYKRAKALNNQIEQFEDLFVAVLNNKKDDKSRIGLYAVGDAVQDEVPLVGRIACDSAGQLNSQSIVLEGSLRTSKCNRIRLDVSSLSTYSLFPGQIVMVSGIYSNDGLFHAKQLTDPPLVPRQKPTNLKNDLSIMVAAGPFLLANGNLSAFDEFLQRTHDDPSIQTLILLGPFVDERSAYVQNLHDKTYEQIFHEMLDKLKSSSLKLILIPSLRDIHLDSIYPLNGFSTNEHRETIFYGSEPSLFAIDDLQCAITSTDILCHLSSEEISSNQTTDRMCRLIRHLFQQRSFYPLIPSHESVSIEYEQALQYAIFDSLPHLFITSSDLRPFVKFVDSICAINVGRLVKNQDSTSGGTYAKIFIKQTNDANLQDHLHVQILRL